MPAPYNDPEVTEHVRGLMQTIPPTFKAEEIDLSPVTEAFKEAAAFQLLDFAENAKAALSVHRFNAQQLLIDNELRAEEDGTYAPPPPPRGGLHANDTSPWRGALTEHPAPGQE